MTIGQRIWKPNLFQLQKNIFPDILIIFSISSIQYQKKMKVDITRSTFNMKIRNIFESHLCKQRYNNGRSPVSLIIRLRIYLVLLMVSGSDLFYDPISCVNQFPNIHCNIPNCRWHDMLTFLTTKLLFTRNVWFKIQE